MTPLQQRWYRIVLAQYQEADRLYETQPSPDTQDRLRTTRDQLNDVLIIIRQTAGIPCHTTTF